MTGIRSDDYVLRARDEEEIARLEFQDRVWGDVTRNALDLAGIGEGDAVAELGCGPGFLTLELARRVGPRGRIVGVDSSTRFLDHLAALARERGLPWIEVREEDVRGEWAEPDTLDAAVCRWVLMFVAEPEAVIERVAAALRPGGTFLSMEYFQFLTMRLHPRGDAFTRTFGAVHRLLTDAGGDPDVGARLPGLLEAAGLEVVSLHPILRVGRPGDAMWRWLEATHANHADLVEAGLLSAEELDEHLREWADAATLPGAFFTAPPLLSIVARKRD